MHRSLVPAVAALALAACHGSSEDTGDTGTPAPPPPGEFVTSDVARDLDPDTTPAQLAQLTADNRRFAFDLYHQLDDGDGNLFFSPHSVSLALAMTYAGAENTTETEMASALRFTLPEAELHPAFDRLDLELDARNALPDEVDGTPPELVVVNQTFGQTGFAFQDSYLDTLARYYGAGMALLDFGADPEGSRAVINDWVEDVTHDRIVDLLPAGSISTLTRLVLVNAIYFKASWAEPFDPDHTTADPFTLLSGTAVDVPTMHGELAGGYASGDGWELVDVPYVGEQLSLSILVPAAGRFAEIEAGLNAAFFDAAVAAADGEYLVTLDLPKFTFRTSKDLVGPLQDLGMIDAFDPVAADFTGMSTAADLYVSGVFHQAFVAVDEEGTEAAAATAVVVGTTSVPDPVTVDIDRPFILVLRDRPTGAVLFVGRVTDPR